MGGSEFWGQQCAEASNGLINSPISLSQRGVYRGLPEAPGPPEAVRVRV